MAERLVKPIMAERGVVADVCDTEPDIRIKFVLEIRYPSGVEVKFGNELTPLVVRDQPLVEWPAEDDQLYTLVMTDPDSLRPESKHWLIVNIPGNDIAKGQPLADYRGSSPPQGTGLHRYVFLVFKQPGLLECSEERVEKTSREGRGRFKTRDFAKKYGLGEPVAVNYFLAEYDDWVAEMRAQRALTR